MRHSGLDPGSPASWQDVWRSFDVDPQIAEAVVWPEMERYYRLQDVLETAANYGTYITTGGGPDFSIGRFQMKPSFVEEMEKAWMASGLARPYELWFDTADNATARRIRITRLQKEEWQVIYLGVFLRLLYYTYGSRDKRGEWTQDGLETLPIEEQVRLAAALDAMSPLRVLTRGYAVASDENGRIVSSVKTISAGSRLRLKLSDGSAACTVESVDEEI